MATDLRVSNINQLNFKRPQIRILGIIKLQCINTGLIKCYSLLHTCEYSFISVAVAESPISSNQRSVSVLASFSAFLLPTFRIPSRKTFVIGT